MVPGDTDTAVDVYRYDAETADLTRVSFGTTGSSGNGEGFDVDYLGRSGRVISNDGQVIVFTTGEPLSPLDGNGSPDVYFWSHGRVFRASAGAKGGTGAGVSASGADVFFATREQLVPSDRDQGNDVYDARVEGGFPQVQAKTCSGEACLPPPAGQPQAPDTPTATPPADPGNVKPKTCPKGKVVKNGRCVKKQRKKQAKKSHRKHKRAAGHGRGDAK
jgi:Tol biopolymer transport system component